MTSSRDLAVPERALAVAAHPDDAEFGCAGTLAKWAAAGAAVDLLVCTDGSKGTWEPTEDLDALVARRQEEQRAALAALGSDGEVAFLDRVDGELEPGRWEISDVARHIRERRPDVVLAHDPWKRYRLHPDHRAAGFIVCDAIVAARDPHFFPEHGLAPHRPSALLLFEADEPDHVEDVTGWADAKIAALLEHRSQHRSTMGIEADDQGEQAEVFRERILDELAETGHEAGATHAEVFRLIDDL